MVLGPDGALWLTEESGDRVARVSENGAVREFPLPRPGQPGLGITNGADGALWFTDRGADEVDRLTTAGSLLRVRLPAGSAPLGICAGPTRSLWVTENGTGNVDRVALDGTVTVAARLGGTSAPFGIAVGADGNLWVAEDSAIARITPQGMVTQFPLGQSGAGTLRIAEGPDHAMWFVEQRSGRVGRIAVDGTIRLLPDIFDQPTSIALGADGHMWMAEEGDGRVDRIDGEHVTPFTVATFSSGPEDIVAGPHRTMWFTEFRAGDVASFSVDAVAH